MNKKSSLLWVVCILLMSGNTVWANDTVCTSGKVTGAAMNIIAFSPLALFLIILLIIFQKLGKEGFKIGDALKENETIDISVDNPAIPTTNQNQANNGLQNQAALPPQAPVPPGTPPFSGKTVQPKSTSRLIVFISGLTSLSIACCFCSFWLYRYFQCGVSTNMDDINNIILALGLGILPYAFNRVSNAFNTNPK